MPAGKTETNKDNFAHIRKVIFVCSSSYDSKMVLALIAQMRQDFSSARFSILLSNSVNLDGLSLKVFDEILRAQGLVSKVARLCKIKFDAAVFIPDGSRESKLIGLFTLLFKRNTSVFIFGSVGKFQRVNLLKSVMGKINPLNVYEAYRGRRFLQRCRTDRKGLEWFYRKYFNGLCPDLQGRLILDVGCMEGRIVSLLSQDNLQVIGLDLRPHSNWMKISGSKFVLADAETPPFKERIFDLCLVFQTLEYTREDLKVLKEINRVLKPKAKLLLKVANKDNFYSLWTGKTIDERHRRQYGLSEIQELLKKTGFAIESVTTEGVRMPLFTKIVNTLFAYPFPERYADVFFSNLIPFKHRTFINVSCIKDTEYHLC